MKKYIILSAIIFTFLYVGVPHAQEAFEPFYVNVTSPYFLPNTDNLFDYSFKCGIGTKRFAQGDIIDVLIFACYRQGNETCELVRDFQILYTSGCSKSFNFIYKTPNILNLSVKTSVKRFDERFYTNVSSIKFVYVPPQNLIVVANRTNLTGQQNKQFQLDFFSPMIIGIILVAISLLLLMAKQWWGVVFLIGGIILIVLGLFT